MIEKILWLIILAPFKGEDSLEFDFPEEEVNLDPRSNSDPKLHPFILMSTSDWTKFQDKMDELGVRDEFKKCGAKVVNITRDMITVLDPPSEKLKKRLENLEKKDVSNHRNSEGCEKASECGSSRTGDGDQLPGDNPEG